MASLPSYHQLVRGKAPKALQVLVTRSLHWKMPIEKKLGLAAMLTDLCMLDELAML